MKAGDKARVKTHSFHNLPKGTEGVILDVDTFMDYVYVKFEKESFKVSMQMFHEEFELVVIEKKATCPVVLTTWFKACEKYIGGENG